MFVLRLCCLALAAVLVAAPTLPEAVNFRAALTSAGETAAKPGQGSGQASATLHTSKQQLSYAITFSGLSGPATVAELDGAKSPVPLPLDGNPASPIKGSVNLTDEQVNTLMAGNLYVSLHTAANPEGEIRGKLMQ
jgi:hypothetical protein